MIADLMIYENGSGGELNLLNEDLETIQGLTNQVYLALFGGNIEQDTSDDLNELDQRLDWWGNSLLVKENQFNSIFERTLKTTVLNSASIISLENAAKEDLKFLEEYTEIEIEAQITGVNKLDLYVTVTEPDQQSIKVKFVWDGTKQTVIREEIL